MNALTQAIGEGLSPAQMREQVLAWCDRQIEVIAQAHGPSWPTHRDWSDAYLREAKRKGLRPFDPMEDDIGNDISFAKRHRLMFNGRWAEIVAQYLRKGSQIHVEGQIRTRKYQDKDGVEKYATDIRVDQMQMLAPAGSGLYQIAFWPIPNDAFLQIRRLNDVAIRARAGLTLDV